LPGLSFTEIRESGRKTLERSSISFEGGDDSLKPTKILGFEIFIEGISRRFKKRYG
jgi:hypothetical protein